MKYAVVTGASRGLGEAVAKLLLESGIHVFGISRNENKTLVEVAKQNNVDYEHFNCDLGKTEEVNQLLQQMMEHLAKVELTNLYLVNNAAVVEPVNQALNITGEDLAYHVHINNIAPMLLMNSLLKFSTETDISFIGVNVTSAAALRPVLGWSAYCSSKASINLYTKTVALEQDEYQSGHKVFAFNPGIMDTGMQETIRSNSEDAFKDVERFKKYKANNDLKSADTVGGILVDIMLDGSNLENGKIYDIQEYIGG